MTENKQHFTVLSVNDWKTRWQERDITFHKSDVHAMLMKYYDKVINGREKIKIFLPLCGKSLDMKWLSDQGHMVIGVEGSEMACNEFFEEQNIKYSIQDAQEVKGKLYVSEDNSIKIYCCDFYLFSSKIEGLMDAVWDRGSLVAINRDDRKRSAYMYIFFLVFFPHLWMVLRYADLMKSLLAPNCQYLLDTFLYDETVYGGPPHFVPEEQIMELFGNEMNIEKLERKDITALKHKDWGLDKFEEIVHLMSWK